MARAPFMLACSRSCPANLPHPSGAPLCKATAGQSWLCKTTATQSGAQIWGPKGQQGQGELFAHSHTIHYWEPPVKDMMMFRAQL